MVFLVQSYKHIDISMITSLLVTLAYQQIARLLFDFWHWLDIASECLSVHICKVQLYNIAFYCVLSLISLPWELERSGGFADDYARV
jgi:hypothetical protein